MADFYRLKTDYRTDETHSEGQPGEVEENDTVFRSPPVDSPPSKDNLGDKREVGEDAQGMEGENARLCVHGLPAVYQAG